MDALPPQVQQIVNKLAAPEPCTEREIATKLKGQVTELKTLSIRKNQLQEKIDGVKAQYASLLTDMQDLQAKLADGQKALHQVCRAASGSSGERTIVTCERENPQQTIALTQDLGALHTHNDGDMSFNGSGDNHNSQQVHSSHSLQKDEFETLGSWPDHAHDFVQIRGGAIDDTPSSAISPTKLAQCRTMPPPQTASCRT